MITRRTMLAAALAALALPGLSACAGRSTGRTIDDATLTARVKTALIGASDVKARDVNVEVYRGVVQLSGFVDSQTEIQRAAEIARGVEGVQSVKNDLRMRPPGQ